MYKSLIIIFAIIPFLNMTSQKNEEKYKIVDRMQLIDEMHPYNMVFVKDYDKERGLYFMKDDNGRIALFSLIGNYAVELSDYKYAKTALESEELRNINETNSFIEQEQLEVLLLSEIGSDQYYLQVCDDLGIPVTSDFESSKKAIFDWFETSGKKISKKNKLRYEFLLLTMLSNESGKDITFEVVPTLKQYLTPMIRSNIGMEVSFHQEVFKGKNKSLGLAMIYNLKLADALDIPPFSKEHQELIRNSR